MLGACLFKRNSFMKCVIGEAGFKKISELKLCTTYESLHFYCSKLSLPYRQPHIYDRRWNAMKFPSVRYNSVQAFEHKKENYSYFEEMFSARKTQAQRSLLLDVRMKKDIPYAVAHCEKYGNIENAFSYSGKTGNSFLLLEFASETAVQELLSNCKCDNIADAFPVCSRLISYVKKSDLDLSEIKVNEESSLESPRKSGVSVSEFLGDIYYTEKLSELDIRLRYFFCALIQETMTGLFKYCDVIPFGSSVNGLGKHGCDLDVMLRLYPKQVNQNSELLFLNKTCVGNHKNFQQKTVACLRDIFQTFLPGLSFVKLILHARVPIVKMDHRILNISCDLSVNNLSAVYMSNVIHFCGEIDTRVRPLISTVKKWAREADLTKSNPGPYISNFGLTNLVLFFLQSRPCPILPPLNEVLQIVGEDNSFNFHVQYLKSIEELKRIASLNEEPLAVLLKEFFSFLATNQFESYTICLMSGTQNPRPLVKDALCLRYIFEESLNITKNVSTSELRKMCEIASISAKVLESNLEHKVDSSTDFKKLIGIPSNIKDSKTQKINVNSMVEDKFPKNRAKYRAM